MTTDEATKRRLAGLIALTWIISLGGSGCSFVMMSDPGPSPVTSRPRCESAAVVPVIDAVGAVASVLIGSAALIGIAGEDSGGAPANMMMAIAGVTLGLATTFTVGSVVGFRRQHRCERALHPR